MPEEKSPIEKRLDWATAKSIEELKSMSALDLIDRTLKFRNGIHNLIQYQKLPAVIIVGCLMDEIHLLEIKATHVAVDENFRKIKKYVDKNFMRKEPMKEVTKK